MLFVETLKEARAIAKELGDSTYRKVYGGWLVMTWWEYRVWRRQK